MSFLLQRAPSLTRLHHPDEDGRIFRHHHHDHHTASDRDENETEPFPDVPQIEIMTAPSVRSSGTTASSSRRVRNRDTGFPEPFNDSESSIIAPIWRNTVTNVIYCQVRNTTLPYPGADLSPNAVISMDDVFVSDPFAAKRSRRTRLSKHKRTVSYGRIDPQTEALHGVMSLIDTSVGNLNLSSDHSTLAARSPVPATLATPISASFSSPRTSKGDSDSLASKRGELETPPSSPDSHVSRKGGILRRLRRLSRG